MRVKDDNYQPDRHLIGFRILDDFDECDPKSEIIIHKCEIITHNSTKKEREMTLCTKLLWQ